MYFDPCELCATQKFMQVELFLNCSWLNSLNALRTYNIKVHRTKFVSLSTKKMVPYIDWGWKLFLTCYVAPESEPVRISA